MGYKNKIEIDYEGLPQWVIRDIGRHFDTDGMGSRTDFLKWQTDLVTFIRTVPPENQILFLQKGIEFMQKALAYHKEFDCNHPDTCSENESWERRIPLAQALLKPAPGNTTTSNIKFAGSKIDLIRVLNALYDLKKFENLNGVVPPKNEFMSTAGQFFNIDLSDYERGLSQAIKEGNLEPNLQIFEDMKTAMQKLFIKKNEKK